MGRGQGTKTCVRGTTAQLKILHSPTPVLQQIKQSAITQSTQLTTTKQSTEIVQTLLHGSISCLSYLRCLFEENCFDDQFYETSNVHWIYDNYAAGRDQPLEPLRDAATMDNSSRLRKATGTRMKVLRRGRNKAVDQLLDWLENGAFEALRRDVLRALQLSIFEDPDKPFEVVELYTFTFYYRLSDGGIRRLEGIEMTGPNNESVSTKSAKYAMQMFIRRLITLCGTLPDLPRRRYLKMHLFYTDDCESDYQPPGFNASNDSAILFPGDQWEKVTSTCGTMDAGFHSVSLKVSHLNPTKPYLEEEEMTQLNRELARHLTYSLSVSREEDVDIEMTAVRLSPPQHTLSSEHQPVKTMKVPLTTQSRSAYPLNTYAVTTSTGNGIKTAGQPKDHATTEVKTSLEMESRDAFRLNDLGFQRNINPAGESQDHVQLSENEDIHIKRQLQQMLEPPNHDAVMEETQLIDSSQMGGGGTKTNTNHALIPQLSQKKIDELNSRRGFLLPPRRHFLALQRRSPSSAPTTDSDIILCQCGWNEEEDDMINCNFCNSWQHLHCYGFTGSDDVRIPRIHACYQCLLSDKESPLLRELQDLAFLRRGVHVIDTIGFLNDKDLATKLHCDLQTASRLATHLRKEDYITPSTSSRRAGNIPAGKPCYRTNKTKPAFSRLLEQYFDPMSKVAHHFELPHLDDILEDANSVDESEHVMRDTRVLNEAPPSQDHSITHQAALHLEDHATTSSKWTRQAAAEKAREGNHTARYLLRHRDLKSQKSQDPTTESAYHSVPSNTPTPTKKRARQTEGTPGTNARPPRKSMRCSATSGLINVGGVVTPSPISTPCRASLRSGRRSTTTGQKQLPEF